MSCRPSGEELRFVRNRATRSLSLVGTIAVISIDFLIVCNSRLYMGASHPCKYTFQALAQNKIF